MGVLCYHILLMSVSVPTNSGSLTVKEISSRPPIVGLKSPDNEHVRLIS